MVVNPPYDPGSHTSFLSRLRADGMTSVFCMAVFGDCIFATKYADNISYYPE